VSVAHSEPSNPRFTPSKEGLETGIMMQPEDSTSGTSAPEVVGWIRKVSSQLAPDKDPADNFGSITTSTLEEAARREATIQILANSAVSKGYKTPAQLASEQGWEPTVDLRPVAFTDTEQPKETENFRYSQVLADFEPYWSSQDLDSLGALLNGKEGLSTLPAQKVVAHLLKSFAPVSPLYNRGVDRIGLSFEQWRSLSLVSGYGLSRSERIYPYKTVRAKMGFSSEGGLNGFDDRFVDALITLTLAAVERYGQHIYPTAEEELNVAQSNRVTESTIGQTLAVVENPKTSFADVSIQSQESILTTQPNSQSRESPPTPPGASQNETSKNIPHSVDVLAKEAGLTNKQLRAIIAELERAKVPLGTPAVRANQHGQLVAHYKKPYSDTILAAGLKHAAYLETHQNS
jgi:hypothetical protein